MQLPAWVWTKIVSIPQGFRGELKLKILNGGVTHLYIEEIVDKGSIYAIDCKKKGFPAICSNEETAGLGKDETDLGQLLT